MFYKKLKTVFCCVDGRPESDKMGFEGDIIRTNRKMLFVNYVLCNRNKSLFVDDITIESGCLGNFLENLKERSAEAGKKGASLALKNPGKH